MKKVICLLLVLALLVLPVTAAETVESVRSMIENLPTVEEFKAMEHEEQVDAYNRTQYAYDAYMNLPSAEEKAQIEGAEKIFDALFSHFNTLVAPAESGKENDNTFVWVILAGMVAVVMVPLYQKKKTA